MKFIKRTSNDASAPIVKPCYVDVSSIWQTSERKNAVRQDLSKRVLKSLLKEPEKA